MLRDGAAPIRRRGKRARIPFATALQRPVPTTSYTQNAPEESDARVRRLIARRRVGFFGPKLRNGFFFEFELDIDHDRWFFRAG
jgi:hypothetical protein